MKKKPELKDLTDAQLETLRQRIEKLRFAPAAYKTGRLNQIDTEIRRRENGRKTTR